MMDQSQADLREALAAAERRAAALQERMDGLQGILDAISEAIYIQDAEGRFLDVNAGAVRMYGHPRDFFIGKTPEIISAPGRNDLGAVALAFGKALQGKPQQFEFWGLRADGSSFPKDVRLYPGSHLSRPVVVAVAQDTTERKRAEQIRDATYRISEAAMRAPDLPSLYRSVHEVLRTLVPAENCYIALHEPEGDTLSFPYWVDQVDEVPAPRPFGQGLTEYVIRTGQPQFIDDRALSALVEAGEAQVIGSDGQSWLGVPLRNDRRVFGALVIQSYEGGYLYQHEDLEILSFVSAQIAMAIDRKASEERLRLVSAAVDGARDSLFWLAEDGQIVFVNEAACQGLGYSREELLSSTVQDINPSMTTEAWKTAWNKLHEESSNVLETAQRRKDGTSREVEVSRTLVWFEGQELIFAVVRDITERKAAEVALRTAEQRLRTVLANSQAIIYQLDPEGRILLSEGLGLAGLGLTPGAVVGLNALDVYRDDPKTVDQLRRALGGEASRQITQAAGRLFDNFTTPVFDQEGHLDSVIGIAMDVTEQQQLEEVMRQSQKLESLGLLAGGIAHDFNNLLTAVLGNLNLAQMHLPEGAPAQPYLAKMEAAILRATELTKQMLAYSGRGHFLVKPLDLNEAVREMTHLLEVSISKKVRLQLDLEPDLPAIQADTSQVQQVVMNLVTNASDAIGDCDGSIHVSTSTALLDERRLRPFRHGDALQPGRYVILQVTDTGMGMSPDVMARIFDPFFTTKASGRGLGLSAMLGILRGHRAGLTIQSEAERGSTFRLCFPASQELHTRSLPVREGAPTLPLQGRVLLVDDEEPILQTIGSALRAFGLEVLTARDGLEALERFRKALPRPDLVLMDLTMPRMDGREAFQAMHDLDPGVPVILSSGFTQQDSLQTLSGAGPAGFIQKPYRITELRELLQRVLGKSD
jgi:PAS domain S-box-containing protein